MLENWSAFTSSSTRTRLRKYRTENFLHTSRIEGPMSKPERKSRMGMDSPAGTEQSRGQAAAKLREPRCERPVKRKTKRVPMVGPLTGAPSMISYLVTVSISL